MGSANEKLRETLLSYNKTICTDMVGVNDIFNLICYIIHLGQFVLYKTAELSGSTYMFGKAVANLKSEYLGILVAIRNKFAHCDSISDLVDLLEILSLNLTEKKTSTDLEVDTFLSNIDLGLLNDLIKYISDMNVCSDDVKSKFDSLF